MNTRREPADSDARARAINPARSFLVQAPAGSGKTELLIQRYLRLLAVVKEPEEILAITFTRKAASEMRKRIEEALTNAREDNQPSAPHLLLGYQLACAVIERDRERNWGLADQSSRMRISTIDAVNTQFSRRVPLSAGYTSHNAVLDDTEPLYREAARATLALASPEDEVGRAVASILAHCDNRAETVETLLQSMLQRRDQWDRLIESGRYDDSDALRELLETNLEQLVQPFIQAAVNAFPEQESSALLQCMRHAGACIAEIDLDSPIRAWESQPAMPGAAIDTLPLWRALATVMLTQSGHWRAKPNKNQGFPVGDAERKEMKARFTELLQRCADENAFLAALEAVATLPDPRYPDSQWTALLALLKILPLTIANLKLLFAQRGQTDFTEVAQEALAALGDEDAASELRLALDYQIRHILLDEFQDTSQSQFKLIESLTIGWESDPDRSLFLVGDPMQSIYGFRAAEVGLFLEAKNHGIGSIKPQFLQLQTNFRSERPVIEWFNQVFENVFPQEEESVIGAVPFAASEAFGDGTDNGGVEWHPIPDGAPDKESEEIVAIVESVAGAHNNKGEPHSVGILVRSRRHATRIAQLFRKRKIAFIAPDLERMDEQPVVLDLTALTRALTHPADRLAWLACLRAPWCGLTLADLCALAAPDHKTDIESLLGDETALGRLSDDGRKRLARCVPLLRAGSDRRGSMPLRDLVESVWLQLGGPATVLEESDLELADHYFEYLGTLEITADCIDGAELLQRLGERAITRRGGKPHVQIMTMHKAKGLEFDTVILPGLASRTRTSSKPLVLFDELASTEDRKPMVIAPIKSVDQQSDAIYDLLWAFEKRKEALEQDRLLYVATTRAKQNLHLFAQLDMDEEGGLRAPANNTLLARLWPVVAEDIEHAAARSGLQVNASRADSTDSHEPEWGEVHIRRIALDWSAPMPEPSCGVLLADGERQENADVEFEWATTGSKHVGSVVHRWLQQIAEEGVEAWDSERIERAQPALRRALRRLGIGRDELDSAAASTVTALQNTLADEHGRWILSSYTEAANEMPVTTNEDELWRNHIIDRTFVTDDGVRWIIDYKTGRHLGGNLAAFLESEQQRYRPQLRRYREALAAIDDRPIKTALYFPLLQVLHEVDAD
jgi:ATP-dependent helicase/nuclease subunit A